MSSYLVVAHETATNPELLQTLRTIRDEDPQSRFTLVVPMKPVGHGLTWTEGEGTVVARRMASDARERFERNGLRVDDALVGDTSPVQAIADTIATGGPFDAIVISTLPAGVSRWLKMDVHARAKRKFNLPVISVEGSPEPAGAVTGPNTR